MEADLVLSSLSVTHLHIQRCHVMGQLDYGTVAVLVV